MAINFNTGPYYDDFDPAKNFYKVLFKPGYAVQARELNQLQSILQHQVSTFANHVFKKNAMVIPGGIKVNTEADILAVYDIADPSAIVGMTITNGLNFDPTDDTTLDAYITAVVVAASWTGTVSSSNPAHLYLKYFKSQSDGRMKFNASEVLKTVASSVTTFTVADAGSTIGKVATIADGTFFTKDTFVDVVGHSIIIETMNDAVTNAAIGLDVIESIVTSDEDESLLDNANGAPNQYAPGADRYKIELQLKRYLLDDTPEDTKFILMMRIEDNVITYLNNNTQYGEIMKMIAQRMHDANGNFIVNGLDVTLNPSIDEAVLWANVNQGRAYLGGYEYSQISDQKIVVEKPRDLAEYTEDVPLDQQYADEMTFFYVAGGRHLKEIPIKNSLVQFIQQSPATLYFNPSADISLSGDTISLSHHHLATGNAVTYTEVGTVANDTGLTSGNTYYVIRVDSDTIKLAASEEDATAGTAVTLVPGAATMASVVKNDVTVVGYAVMRGFQYVVGEAGTNEDIYVMYFDQVTWEAGFSYNDVGGVRAITANEGTPVLHLLTLSQQIKGSTGDSTFNVGDVIQSAADSTQTGSVYKFLNNQVVAVIKNTAGDVPYSDSILNATTGSTAIREATFITNYDDMNIAMYEVDKSPILTLYDANTEASSVSYSVTTSHEVQLDDPDGNPVQVSAPLVNISGTHVWAEFSAQNYVGVITSPGYEKTFDLTGILALSEDRSSWICTFASEHEARGKTIRIYGRVDYMNVSESSKNKSDSISVTIHRPVAGYMALSDQDIIAIDTIREGLTLAVYNANSPALSAAFDPYNNTITIYTADDHGLQVGDTVVIRNLVCSNYPTAYDDQGYNGVFTVSAVGDVNQFSFTFTPKSITIDPTTDVGAENVITSTNHGYKTGTVVQYTAAGDAITGLTDGSSYYVVRLSADTFYLANSFLSIPNNSRVAISAGTATGNHVFALLEPGTYNQSASGAGYVALPVKDDSNDVTKRFDFWNGQNHDSIGTSLIKLRRYSTLPAGQLSVVYRKFTQNSDGGFVSVDSYGSLASLRTDENDLSWIGKIPEVKTPFNENIPLRSYLDFRTITSNYFFKNMASIASGSTILKLKDLNLQVHHNALVGKYVVGPSHRSGATILSAYIDPLTNSTNLVLSTTADNTYEGAYYVGLNGAGLSIADTSAGGLAYDLPRPGNIVEYSYTRFLPRKLVIFLNRSNDDISIEQMDVAGIDDVHQMRRDPNRMPLIYISMEPYCVDMTDVSAIKFENPGYTMQDIHELAQKVDRVEYYTSLALNTDIHDQLLQAGNEDLTEASQGFWNEDFEDIGAQDLTSPDFKATIYDKAYVSPGVVTRTIDLVLDDTYNTNSWKQEGPCVMMPYTEQTAISQTLASRFNNLNPFNVTQWTGKMVLTPSVDNWVEVTVPPAPIVVQPTPPDAPQPPTPPVIPMPPVPTLPSPVLPDHPVEEYVTKITKLKAAWGPDTAGGKHAISFYWETNKGRKGVVHADKHKSAIIKKLGKKGYDGSYARSLINKRYTAAGVKAYLHAGNYKIKNSKAL